MNVYYEVTRYDSGGQLQEHRFPTQSKSFVKAFLQMLYIETSTLGQDIVDISNTSRTISSASQGSTLVVTHPGLSSAEDTHQFTTLNTGSGDVYADDCGIVVGTSATAVAVADDNLVSQTTHGSSSGQLVHYGSYGLNYTTGASTSSVDLERIFRNDSGGTITIAEIGIYAMFNRNGTGPFSNVVEEDIFGACINRDVISPTVGVLNGEYLKVKYTISVSV